MRRSVSGPFLVRDLGRGACSLTTTVSANIDIVVQGVEPNAMQAPALANCNALSLEWRDDGVILTLSSPAGARSVSARSAIIHEPQARLYDGLPLASFDDDARRFWRRVFRLVRIPGGRYLLGLLARRKRSRA